MKRVSITFPDEIYFDIKTSAERRSKAEKKQVSFAEIVRRRCVNAKRKPQKKWWEVWKC